MDSTASPQDPFASPAFPGNPSTGASGWAIASLVLGLLSFFFTMLTGIPAIICGVIALSKIASRPSEVGGKGLAIAGITTGGIGSLLTVGCLVAMLLPAVQAARAAARQNMSLNNVKQLALCMHNYESENRMFPPVVPDAEGNGPLVSWRVHMLKYLGPEEAALYGQFHLDEPWDSEHNLALAEQTPVAFQSPVSNAPPGYTVYLAVTGPGAAFQGGEQGPTFRSLIDGTSNTLMLVEADDSEAVPWSKPADWVFDPANPVRGLGGLHPTGVWIAGFFDGHAERITTDFDPAVMNDIVTCAGGEKLQ